MKEFNESKYYKTRELAEMLGFKPGTVKRKAKKIPGSFKVFGEWRFNKNTVRAWITKLQGEV